MDRKPWPWQWEPNYAVGAFLNHGALELGKYAHHLAPVRSILTFLLLGRRHPFEHQLLHSCGSLREINIAFGIGRDVMARSQNAGRLDRAHDI